jgi:16S rRNA (uracil1498-N3)-methyltransferase
MRVTVGTRVGLFNGRDGEWIARVEALGKRAFRVVALEQSRPQEKEPDVWLLFAPLKRTALEFLIEKAVELGVSRLCPVTTQRSIVDRLNPGRLRLVIAEASEQCRRLSVPELFPIAPLERTLQSWPEERPLWLCAESGDALPIRTALIDAPPAAAFLIGPEGGFADSELDALRQFPFVVPINLGPRILRAETAALAALACWQALAGDGTCRPPPGEGRKNERAQDFSASGNF